VRRMCEGCGVFGAYHGPLEQLEKCPGRIEMAERLGEALVGRGDAQNLNATARLERSKSSDLYDARVGLEKNLANSWTAGEVHSLL
jgi:hypothetical protein